MRKSSLLAGSEKLPRHVAVVMDGNRRWAQKRYLPSIFGHRAGVKSFRRLLELCRFLEIRHLTAYAFSVENWSRASDEVKLLMKLFFKYAVREREKMVRTGIRFQVIGDLEGLPQEVREAFLQTEQATRENSDLVLNLAVNYSSKRELLDACQKLLETRQASRECLSEQDIEKHLWTAGQPDPDLLIRTSGEMRLSNFMLWQMAYTELYFCEKMWPEMNEEDFIQAFRWYSDRERRFGE